MQDLIIDIALKHLSAANLLTGAAQINPLGKAQHFRPGCGQRYNV
jgi:hypothetical protein